MVYYCSSEHQSAHWTTHKKFCSLVSEDHQSKAKLLVLIKDQDCNILQFQVKKTLGLLLQFDTQHEVVFINDIVHTSNSVFKVGDQILQINDMDIIFAHIIGQTDIGNGVEFKIKRPKKTK